MTTYASKVSIQIKPGNLHTSEAIERRVYDKLAGVCTRFGAMMTARWRFTSRMSTGLNTAGMTSGAGWKPV